MNRIKIAALKQKLDAAVAMHDAERDRLDAAGLKSGERYQMLKPLKASVDAANAEYNRFTVKQIHRAMDAIIHSA
jgi:hypothetical protein